MQVEIDGEVVSKRVLNDALFCHRSPAATTRYILQPRRDRRSSRSRAGCGSGPAAGSTAAIRSAGGTILAPGSRRLQYVVREPYEPSGGQLRAAARFGGARTKSSTSLSQIREGRVFLDGPHVQFEVPIGSRVKLRRSAEYLSLLDFPRALQAAARRRERSVPPTSVPPGR